MSDVTALTGGDVTFEVLPACAVVGVKETLDADKAGHKPYMVWYSGCR